VHESAFKFVARAVMQLPPRRRVLELGSRVVAGPWPYAGPVRPLFDGAEYLGVDAAPGEGVDVVGDAGVWRPDPFRRFDTVVCTEVLEHAPGARDLCENARRLLEPGGVFIVTAAGPGRAPHSSVDGGPLRPGEFYRNVADEELRAWLAPFGFALVDSFSAPGDVYGLAVKLGEGS
jgi:SAM-dependent methyltransferase